AEPKTNALGGVPAGSAKSDEADNVAANRVAAACSGATLPARIGSITAVVAAFDANAASATVATLAATTCANAGAARSAASCAPNQCESPLAWIAAASENPPPSSTSVSHC